jgi:hypothetical protein
MSFKRKATPPLFLVVVFSVVFALHAFVSVSFDWHVLLFLFVALTVLRYEVGKSDNLV